MSLHRWWLTLTLTVALAPTVDAAGVAVVGTVVSDNGDDDGYADTQETVTVRLVVRNTSGVDLTDLIARMSTSDGALACLTTAEIGIGDLAAGEERTTEDGFVFVVGSGVERAAVTESLAARFVVSVVSSVLGELAGGRPVDFDLDLDVAGGSGPTTFFESFEDGFGAFTTMHLDEPLNPPESDLGNGTAGVLMSDGWRCQYNDPYPSFGDSQGQQCYPNPNGAHDAFYFHVVTDRAFSGEQSMGFNVFLDEARGYTTPTAQLEAIRTLEPVNLAWARACSVAGTFCDSDLDCPAGEACRFADPTLSLKHQISHFDHRSEDSTQPGRTADRSVIGVQLADAAGLPVGPWLKAYPFVNVYDSQANSNYTNCSFDPIDDGNTEHDYFDPTDTNRSQGPSSTCAPEFSFADQGDTDDPFVADNVGDADPGAGLEGDLGIGTWVEPVVDLLRFRGRRVRIRLLTSGLKLGGAVTWDQPFQFNPGSGDDGWFVDDITVTHALMEPATAAPDTRDNSALPYDLGSDVETDGVFDVCDNCPGTVNPGQTDQDGDGFGDACDICPLDPDNDGDGDGFCRGADNCPELRNPTQLDSDGDGFGDPCDICPFDANPDQGLDEDEDGIDCPADNCAIANPDQEDADADGVGDVCDACPDDPQNDPDGDGFCGMADSCPFVPSLGAGIQMVSPASTFRVSSDGMRLVARRGGLLWSVPATAVGDGVRLSDAAAAEDYAITPDSATVVYRHSSGDYALYSVPIHGDSPTRLSPDVSGGRVAEFLVSPDGSRIVFRMEIGARDDLFSVPTGGGAATVLTPAGAFTTIRLIRISPDGSRVLFVLTSDALWGVEIEGGTPVRLSPRLSPQGWFMDAEFSPDGSRVVYVADQDVDNMFELYSGPADGSAPAIRLNPPLVNPKSDVGLNGQPGFGISPDGASVVYAADQETLYQEELFVVPIDGGPAVKLSVGDVQAFDLTPDGSLVVFNAAITDVGVELLAVPAGGGMATYLTHWGENVDRFQITPDGSRVVYRRRAFSAQILYAVALADGATVSLSPDPFVERGDTLHISADGSRVLYLEGADPHLYSVSIDGGPRIDVSEGKFVNDGSPLDSTPDGSIAYWVADDPIVYAIVYATWLDHDPDGDALHTACDCDGTYQGLAEVNDGRDSQCPGDAGFGVVDELEATAGFNDAADPLRFSWTPQPAATGYEVVRSGDPDFDTDCARTPTGQTGIRITEVPAEGAAFYYMARATAPNPGSPGADSSGIERSGACLTNGSGG